MFTFKIMLTLLIAASINPIVLAQDKEDEFDETIRLKPVVVTADRIEVPLDRVSSSVTLITAESIERQQVNDVSEVLRNVSGVDIVRSGSPGRLTSLFMRGSNSNHTLVMLDGIQINDPLGAGFDYANLSIDNVKNIEVVRGTQSTLYGSEAIGGIISISTKNGSNDFKLSANVESGSFGTFKESGNISGSTNLLNYALSFSQIDTDGLFDNDDYSRTTFSANISTEFNADTKLTFISRISDSDGGTPGKRILDFDPNARSKTILESQSLLFSQKVSNKWHHKISASRSAGELDLNDPANPDTDESNSTSLLNSSIVSFDWQNDFHISQYLVITSGVEWEERQGKRESSFANFENVTNTRSIYLLNHIRINDNFNISVGGRSDDHSTFGRNNNFRIASAYIFSNSLNNETKIRGSIGTGFRTPSINELFWPGSGNINLKPEESTSLELGVEQKFSEDKFTISVDLFKLDFKNLIAFGLDCFCSDNIKEAETQGLEFRTHANLNDQLTASGNYTFLETDDNSTGDPLLRRPKHSGGLNISYTHVSSLQLNIGLTFVGERFDSGFTIFPAVYEFTPSYKTFRIASSYNISGNVRLKLKIENLLDEEYSEVIGFPSPGRAVYGGIGVNL